MSYFECISILETIFTFSCVHVWVPTEFFKIENTLKCLELEIIVEAYCEEK